MPAPFGASAPRMQCSGSLSSMLPAVEDSLLGCWDSAEESVYLWNKYLTSEHKACSVSSSFLYQCLLSLCPSVTLVQAPSSTPGRAAGASTQPVLCLIALQMAVVCACLLGASIAPEITNRLQPRVFKVLLGSHPKLPPLPTSFLPSEFQVFKFQLAMAGPLCPLPLSVPIYSSNSSLINDILWRPCLRTCSLASCFAPSDTNHDYTLIFN